MQLRNGKIINTTRCEVSNLVETKVNTTECSPDINEIVSNIKAKLEHIDQIGYQSYTARLQYAMHIFNYVEKVLPVIEKEHTKPWLKFLNTVIDRIDVNYNSLDINRAPSEDVIDAYKRLYNLRIKVSDIIKSW